jgi:hypothetical protein
VIPPLQAVGEALDQELGDEVLVRVNRRVVVRLTMLLVLPGVMGASHGRCVSTQADAHRKSPREKKSARGRL